MKKYILFKLDPAFTKTEDDVLFAQLELESFFPSVKPLQTIFEVLNYAEIKNLVEHDTKLQRILTQDLSHGPFQAFLTTDDNGLAIEKAIKRLAFVGDILFFQRSHDSMILYLQYLLTNRLVSLHTVFNWHIIQISSLQSQLAKIETPALTGNSYLSERHIRALVNWNIPNSGPMNDNATNGSLAAIFAAEMDIVTYVNNNNDNLPHLQAFILDSHLINKSIQVLIERLNELLKQKTDRQSHLFFDDINTLFMEYKSEQIKNIKSKQLQKIDEADQEAILAVKFLIESNIITEHKKINNLLHYLLVQAVAVYSTNHPSQQFFSFLKEYFKHFHETQQVFTDIKGQYALAVRQIQLIESDTILFNGIMNLNHVQKSSQPPVVEVFFPNGNNKISSDLPNNIPAFHDYNNDELKNFGVYTGKTLLYLKSINAIDDFNAVGKLYFTYVNLLNNAQSRLNNEGRICITAHGYATPVIDLNIESLFTDIAKTVNITLYRMIPLQRNITGKQIYIVLFEKK